MTSYQTFEVPENVQKEALEILQQVSKTGKIKKGTNEVIKAIERSQAKIVYIALDVTPEEIVAVLPLLCNEKKVPYIFISTKKNLGVAAGMGVGSASVAVIDAGKAEDDLKRFTPKIANLGAGTSKPEQANAQQEQSKEAQTK